MAFPSYYQHDNGADWITTSYSRGPPLNHSSRSWTDNGVQYTVNTATFSAPGLSFGAMTRNTSDNIGAGLAMPTRNANRTSTFVGNAFGMLEDMLSTQEQQRNVLTRNNGQDGRRQVELERESGSTSSSEDHLAYEKYDNQNRARPQSMFSKIKSRFLDTKPKPRKEDIARESSPAKKISAERPQTAHRSERKEPGCTRPRPRTATQPADFDRVSSSSEDEYHDIHSPRQSEVDNLWIQALENAVEVQRRAVKSCKRRLEQATRQPNASSSLLQRVVDDMKHHEMALATATSSLRRAKSEQRRSAVPQQRPRPQSYHPRSAPVRQASVRRPPPPPTQPPSSLEEHFIFTPLDIGIESGWHPEHDPDPVFAAFEQLHGFQPFARPQSFGTYEHIFGGGIPEPASDARYSFFAMPGDPPQQDPRKNYRYSHMPPPNTSHRESIPNYRGTSFTPPPPPKASHRHSSANFSYKTPPQSSHRHSSAYQAYSPPQPRPPANLMRPEEAKHLFKLYTDRWNNLSPLDPNVPYPARGLAAASLSARDTLFAPDVDVSISSWSEETVMQANAQAFYLGVVGLKPAYSEVPGTGRVECGFEKARATAPQIKELTDLLKKEKVRWHSDRLGRRNKGNSGGGQNEALQKDERARAVFHAVCELMERAAE